MSRQTPSKAPHLSSPMSILVRMHITSFYDTQSAASNNLSRMTGTASTQYGITTLCTVTSPHANTPISTTRTAVMDGEPLSPQISFYHWLHYQPKGFTPATEFLLLYNSALLGSPHWSAFQYACLFFIGSQYMIPLSHDQPPPVAVCRPLAIGVFAWHMPAEGPFAFSFSCLLAVHMDFGANYGFWEETAITAMGNYCGGVCGKIRARMGVRTESRCSLIGR